MLSLNIGNLEKADVGVGWGKILSLDVDISGLRCLYDIQMPLSGRLRGNCVCSPGVTADQEL